MGFCWWMKLMDKLVKGWASLFLSPSSLPPFHSFFLFPSFFKSSSLIKKKKKKEKKKKEMGQGKLNILK